MTTDEQRGARHRDGRGADRGPAHVPPGGPRAGWVVTVVSVLAVVVAVFGRTGPSLAAAVMVVAILAYLQAAPVSAAVRSALASVRRFWSADRERH